MKPSFTFYPCLWQWSQKNRIILLWTGQSCLNYLWNFLKHQTKENILCDFYSYFSNIPYVESKLSSKCLPFFLLQFCPVFRYCPFPIKRMVKWISYSTQDWCSKKKGDRHSICYNFVNVEWFTLWLIDCSVLIKAFCINVETNLFSD